MENSNSHQHICKNCHNTCYNNQSDSAIKFQHFSPHENEVFQRELTPCNYLMLVLSGTISTDCDNYHNQQVGTGQMILIPKAARTRSVALEASEVILLEFDLLIGDCALFKPDNYMAHCQATEYSFSPTPIKEPVNLFLSLLSLYLHNDVQCSHIHELKYREFFLCLRTFYSTEEVAYLLHPIIGHSLNFKHLILSHAKEITHIKELINLSNMSKSKFYTVFKQEFGITAKQWMLNRQKTEITQIVANPRLSVKEIMEQLGFDNYNQFGQFCKQHFNCSPTALIHTVREKE